LARRGYRQNCKNKIDKEEREKRKSGKAEKARILKTFGSFMIPNDVAATGGVEKSAKANVQSAVCHSYVTLEVL
jgi:hypothetical protein